MKLNWGTSIFLAFVLFISFIMFFVITVETDKKYDSELVVEEYYKHDAKFGEEMKRIQNAEDLAQKPIIKYDANFISIAFPEVYNPIKIKGKISLYRPSNKKLDFEIPISLTSATLLIPKKSLVDGRWDVSIEWQYEGKAYLSKKEIYIK